MKFRSINKFPLCNVDDTFQVKLPEVDRSKEVLTTKKSLREIANVQSFSGGRGFKKCLCKNKCLTNKCKCKSGGIFCNSKCHPNSNCSNK
ncbi:hypothetical protein QTP88_007501 [Uroleucon formosanum]